jgi:hypothetical protein
VQNGSSGYTLRAQTDSLDDAMARFQHTAAKLCPEGSYEFGEPAIVDRGTTPITFGIELTCTGA